MINVLYILCIFIIYIFMGHNLNAKCYRSFVCSLDLTTDLVREREKRLSIHLYVNGKTVNKHSSLEYVNLQ